jgi:hypothetical protein
MTIFTDEFWQTLGGLIASRPSIIVLVLVVFVVGLVIQRWVDGGEIRGLKAAKDAAETRLNLAQDEQKAVTAPVEILNNTKLETEVAALRMEVAQIKGVLPPSVITQLDKVASTVVVVTSATRTLSEANTVLGSTLSGSGGLKVDDSLVSIVTRKSE